MVRTRRAPSRVLPGFRLALGYTLFYLCLIVLIPLTALAFKTFTLTWAQFWEAVTAPRVLAAYKLTFGIVHCRAGQCHCRSVGGLGAGAVRISR